ncbi:MAG TPA: FAD-dependent monooxygenase [Thermoanaerobaculia bacterium]|nr:FAD-dependent monooxygenase [Thermoanaerobaculia bacterium]
MSAPRPSAATEVLIVGAGPTGLMLANQLVRRGVRPRIIERHEGPARQTRALGVQARTLEIYEHLGIAQRAIELGTPSMGMQMWRNGKFAARVPVGDIGRDQTPYPYVLILGQDDNERLLGEILQRAGIRVEWNTELVGLTQENESVRVTLKRPDATREETTAAWVAGCDGARSAVRDFNRIPFVGAPYEHVFYVADTRMTGPMAPGEVNGYLWPRGFHLFFPLRGIEHWRLVGIVPEDLRGREGLTFEDVVPSIQREAQSRLSFQECTWFSTYRIAHRRAERFRERRCFVLGDAAHVHSPVGAQGMNTGLQDAYNLAWKLGLVVSGAAESSLLDTYAREREPVAQQLLATTDRAFSFLVSGNRLAQAARLQLLPRGLALAMGIGRLRKAAFRTISQTGIRYRKSSLSVTLAGLPREAPQAGDRFPWFEVRQSPGQPARGIFADLDDTRFTLVVRGQPGLPSDPPGRSGLLRTTTISEAGVEPSLERLHIPSPSFFLVRPDGYIGLCGGRLDPQEVARYFDRVLGGPRRPDSPENA